MLNTFSLAVIATLIVNVIAGSCDLVCNSKGICHIANPDSLQCRVCGYEFGSAPTKCLAFEASFDALEVGNQLLETFKTAGWTGFTVAKHSTSDPIIPSSPHHFAKSGPSGDGVLSFEVSVPNDTTDYWDFGNLYSFDFACAQAGPDGVNQPVACTLNVTSTCINETTFTEVDFHVSEDYLYLPSAGNSSPMTKTFWNGSEVGAYTDYFPYFCHNYTFEAVTTNGSGPVFLYLDNVIYNHWYDWE